MITTYVFDIGIPCNQVGMHKGKVKYNVLDVNMVEYKLLKYTSIYLLISQYIFL